MTFNTCRPTPPTLLLLIFLTCVSCKKEKTFVLQPVQSSSFSLHEPGGTQPEHIKPPPKQFEQRPLKPLSFKNVVILGNSITFTPLNPYGEWKGNWGMAASAADSDYVHRLAIHLKTLNPDCIVRARNIAEFEIDYVNYNFDANLKDLEDSAPDLLILRIGEDVDVPTYNAGVFKARYTALIDYFFAKNSKLTVLGVGPIWNAYLMETAMADNPYVSLAHVNDDRSNDAYGQFVNPGLEIHPNDRGMRVISDSIWSGIQRLKPVR